MCVGLCGALCTLLQVLIEASDVISPVTDIPGFVLPLETKLRSVVYADARGHVDVCDPLCYQKPCGSP